MIRLIYGFIDETVVFLSRRSVFKIRLENNPFRIGELEEKLHK